MDELDRILTDDPEIQPTIGFSTRVMRAVREEAEGMAPIPFPWARFLPGLCVSLVLLLVALIGWFSEAASSPASLAAPSWLGDPQLQGLLWALVTLAGTGAMVWAVLRWSSPRRTVAF